MPKMLDLFCGTKSVANAFAAAGWEVYTVDWNEQFKPTLCADIGTLSKEDIIQLCGGIPDVIWLSPDCTTYSVAALRYHRRKDSVTGDLIPVSEYAVKCDQINKHIIDVVINQLQPKYFFIENPRGCFRKMDFVKDIPRYTVTYCQYEMNKPVEERRMKPTDIFTNHPAPEFKPPCKNGAPCHQAAPRGSATGTTALKRVDRSRIPQQLCQHIVELCEV